MSSNGWKNITWQQFRDAFDWDQSNFSLPLHEKLTLAHFDIDSAAKMQNHLAKRCTRLQNAIPHEGIFFMVKQLFPSKLKTVSKGTHVHFCSTI